MTKEPDARILKMHEELTKESLDMVQKEGCSPFEMAIMMTAAAEMHLMLNNEDLDDKIMWLDYVIEQYKQMRKTLRGIKKLQGD